MRNQTLSILIAVLFATVSVSSAAPIFYGDFVGDTVMYQNVFEDSGTDPGVALYGAPSVFGNALIFSPPSFYAVAPNNGDFDLTDGTLGGFIMAGPNSGIESLIFEERGDFTLLGVGGSGTAVQIAATYFVDILEVDGNVLDDPIEVFATMTFTPDNEFDLINDPGQAQFFSGSVEIDLAQAILDAELEGLATKVKFQLDNSLSMVDTPTSRRRILTGSQ